MYKYDLHVHTSEVSSCGKVKAAEIIKLYQKADYHGLVITDHFYRGFFEEFSSPSSWDEKIDQYLAGYYQAREVGKKTGFRVLLGMEIRLVDNANDYLVYGITEDFLRKHPEMPTMNLQEFTNMISSNKDIMIFQAHPFRSRMIPADPQLVDGMEILNGNPRHQSHNHRAYNYALEHNLKMIAGSDFHQREDLDRGGIFTEIEILDEKQLVEILKNNQIIKYHGLE